MPGTKPGFLKSEKMLGFKLLYIHKKCIRSLNPNIFSDLRKPGLVPGESLSLSIKINSVLEKYLSYIMTNRMKSIHMKLSIEYGRENVKIFW